MTPTRRQVVTGLCLSTVTPRLARAVGGDDAAVRRALDEAASLPPDRALARLARIEAMTASSGLRLDFAAARAGLRIDLKLAGASPTAADRFSLQLQRVTGDGIRLAIVARDLDHARRALTARASRLFDTLAIPGATIGPRFEALWRDPRHLYPDDDGGHAAAVADMRATLATIRPRMPALFGALPPECLDADVRTLDATEIAAGKSGYRILPSPGIAGTYVVDLKTIRRRPRFSLPSVVAHELLPGHMIQMPLEARAAPHPLRLRYTTAFSEGWAVYAEMLMDAVGLYALPLDQLGHIHWMLFRVCRGLIDIALHTGGLSQSEARELLLQWQGEPAYFASFYEDIDRILKKPASFAAEAWLALHIARHRPRDIKDLPTFHSNMLNNGRLRLEQMSLYLHR